MDQFVSSPVAAPQSSLPPLHMMPPPIPRRLTGLNNPIIPVLPPPLLYRPPTPHIFMTSHSPPLPVASPMTSPTTSTTSDDFNKLKTLRR